MFLYKVTATADMNFEKIWRERVREIKRERERQPSTQRIHAPRCQLENYVNTDLKG